ncbi:hypothetical protein IW261DRAFT_1612028 [Armillaria novae-zelandiae]|uniref:Uncharacterized protein n=1 Tax=Armillaria novae-zelandiae TaxID=153914 RepID=A0AA39NTK6_9AGAR|nr:hypothetical protein IW261DRAFT_1612028 [Armillaria novae-zelandiae]
MTTAITRHGTILQKPNDDLAKDIFQALDVQLNSMMVEALSHGIYTGLIVFALWTVVSSKRRHDYGGSRSILLTLMIVLVYLLTTFGFCVNWIANARIFIVNGQNFSTVFKAYNNPFPSWVYLVVGITAGVNTILTEATLIWRCWIVCGRNSRVIVVPVISTTMTVVSKGVLLYHHCADGDLENMDLYNPDSSHWALIYSSAILVTLLWCTVLIIYRIISVAIDPCWYICALEITAESASLYSVFIIILLVLEAHNDTVGMYVEALAIAMRGIVPTMQVGRVASGCARPDDYWSGSSVSESLRFTTSSAGEQSQDGMDFDGIMSVRSRSDLEDGLGNGAQSLL